MAIYRSSRYLRQGILAVPTTASGNYRNTYVQRDTTIFPAKRPSGTRDITVPPSEDFAYIANTHLGRQQYWWILADMNPDTAFYPLDLSDADTIYVPPISSVSRFQRSEK